MLCHFILLFQEKNVKQQGSFIRPNNKKLLFLQELEKSSAFGSFTFWFVLDKNNNNKAINTEQDSIEKGHSLCCNKQKKQWQRTRSPEQTNLSSTTHNQNSNLQAFWHMGFRDVLKLQNHQS